jgi:hypothetical protein
MKRILPLALALALAVPVVAAGAARSHRINATIHAANVASEGNVGIIAGTLSDATFGQGAVVYAVSGSTSNAKITFTAFATKGTVKGKGTASITPAQGGSLNLSGNAKITGGTGLYKRATGKFTVNGTEDSSGHITLHATGSVKY